MTVPEPHYASTPHRLLIRGSLPSDDPIFSGLDFSTDFGHEVASSFQYMRDLTQTLNNETESQNTSKIMLFSETRIDTVHRLLSAANTKSALEMSTLDYQVEVCRLAALTYLKIALHPFIPRCAAIRNLRSRFMNLIKQREANGTVGVGACQQPISISWAFFAIGSLSFDREETKWFAQRLAKGIGASGVETWSEMERRLRQICWLDKLNTSACRDLWSMIMAIHAEYGAAQVRDIAPDRV